MDIKTDRESENLFQPPPMQEQERMLEALLFASSAPLSLSEIESRLPHGSDAEAAMELLCNRYQERGVRVMKLGDGYAFRTAHDLGFLLQKEVSETRKLSRAAIETLAIIAYHQPVTRAEIEEIRGVSVSRGSIDALLELDWIKLGRRRMTPGRPVTFVVTPGFLDHFGLENARDLPGIRELREAGLLDNRPPPEMSAVSEGEDGENGDIDAQDQEEQEELFE
ncbi:MAG: SMC-Scp complex subunit ScpB [Paracoccaceae bacterium]